MYEKYPLGSPVDLRLFLEGWDRGAEFGFCRACSKSLVLDEENS